MKADQEIREAQLGVHLIGLNWSTRSFGSCSRPHIKINLGKWTSICAVQNFSSRCERPRLTELTQQTANHFRSNKQSNVNSAKIFPPNTWPFFSIFRDHRILHHDIQNQSLYLVVGTLDAHCSAAEDSAMGDLAQAQLYCISIIHTTESNLVVIKTLSYLIIKGCKVL